MASFKWQSSILKEAGLVHGSTDASFGVLRHGWADEPEVSANRETLRKKLDLNDQVFVLCEQVHGNQVIVVDVSVAREPFVQLGKADAMITNQNGVVLVIKTADCVPVFLFDPVHNAVGVIHSGWKGTLANIIAETVAAMGKEYKTNPSEILAAIGPAICARHYDVSDTTDGRIERFTDRFADPLRIVLRHGAKTSLGLPQACRQQCLQAGIPEQQVELSGVCTFESPRWPSYRREGANLTHDIWSYITRADTKA